MNKETFPVPVKHQIGNVYHSDCRMNKCGCGKTVEMKIAVDFDDRIQPPPFYAPCKCGNIFTTYKPSPPTP